MGTVTPVLVAVFLLGAGAGVAVWFVLQRARAAGSRKETGRKAVSRDAVSFRWNYILLPVALLSLSLIAAAAFYRRLPAEFAYHFTQGSPDRWVDREAFLASVLALQCFFTLLAATIVWGTVKLGARFKQPGSAVVNRLLVLMGNMVALPQVILSFAMLDIFSYNSYQAHIMPLGLFALIVIVGGGVILGVYFTLTVRQVWRLQRKSSEE